MVELAQLYYQFWSSLSPDLPAYVEGFVPTTAELPYLTYSLINNEFSGQTAYKVMIWTRSNSLSSLMGYLDILSKAIPEEGATLNLNNSKGSLTLFRGDPFWQIYPQEEIDIKAAYINLTLLTHIL